MVTRQLSTEEREEALHSADAGGHADGKLTRHAAMIQHEAPPDYCC